MRIFLLQLLVYASPYETKIYPGSLSSGTSWHQKYSWILVLGLACDLFNLLLFISNNQFVAIVFWSVCLFCLCQLSKFPKVFSYLLIPADAVHLSTETSHSLPSLPINFPINMQIGKFYLSTKTVSTAIHGLSP